MTRLCRASVLAALSVFASVTMSHAECAWVLWSGKTMPWRAHETKKDCEGDRNVQLAIAALDAKKYGSPYTKAPDLECLPDTTITETPSKCNWMLWKYDVTMPTPMKTVFASKQKCEIARDNANRARAKAGESSFSCGELDTSTPQQPRASVWRLRRTPVVKVMHSLIGTFKTYRECQTRRGADVMTRKERELAFCLPDTVDPRRPKGK